MERLVRFLDPRCQDGDLPGRLRAATESYLSNGGVFSAPVLPAVAGAPHEASVGLDGVARDGDSDPPPPLLRHRLLEPGFRLKSKAFMLTYNSATFTEETWTEFLAWVKQTRRTVGARRWAACFEESKNASARAAGVRASLLCRS